MTPTRLAQIEEVYVHDDYDIPRSIAEELIQAVRSRDARIAELEAALGFYCDETNFKIVDEGRNYSTEIVLYEEDPRTLIEMPFGKIAREVLAKKGTP